MHRLKVFRTVTTADNLAKMKKRNVMWFKGNERMEIRRITVGIYQWREWVQTNEEVEDEIE